MADDSNAIISLCPMCTDMVSELVCVSCIKSRLCELNNKLNTLSTEMSWLQSRISTCMQPTLRKFGLALSKQAVKERLIRLRTTLEEQNELVEVENATLTVKRLELEDRQRRLSAEKVHFDKLRSRISAEQYTQTLEIYEVSLVNKMEALARTRRNCIHTLLYLMPVLPVSQRECRVADIVLPNYCNYSGVPLTHVAAAMGYITKLVSILAQYLDVFLPCPVSPEDFDTRHEDDSCDEPITCSGMPYAPGSKGRIALSRLNFNINVICLTQGIPVTRSQANHTLLNLLACVNAANLGREGPVEIPPHMLEEHLPIDEGESNSISSNGIVAALAEATCTGPELPLTSHHKPVRVSAEHTTTIDADTKAVTDNLLFEYEDLLRAADIGAAFGDGDLVNEEWQQVEFDACDEIAMAVSQLDASSSKQTNGSSKWGAEASLKNHLQDKCMSTSSNAIDHPLTFNSGYFY